MNDIIEGELVSETAIAIRDDTQAGTRALAALTDDEFTYRLHELKRGRDRIATIQRELMDKDVDYGTIPGTPKPTLYKPGAEKLCDIYALRADFMPERIIGDGVTAPHLAYQTRCQLHLGSLEGPAIAVGYGSANSWERKHRYRLAERACPNCGTVGTLLKSKQGKPEWFCWAKRGGCGQTFPLADVRIVEQVVGYIENADPWDLDTTLLKMAEKRAHVDATLRATAASGLFTQDVEDSKPDESPNEPRPPRAPREQATDEPPWPEGSVPVERATRARRPEVLQDTAPVIIEAPGPSDEHVGATAECGAVPPGGPMGMTLPCDLRGAHKAHRSPEGTWPA